jgi:hypothetical protein
MTGNEDDHINLTPTRNDLQIASLVHCALTAVRGAGRFGDRKVFISSLWAMVLRLDAETGNDLTDGATIEHFKAWLLRTRRATRDGTADGAPLVVLSRADFIAAMDHTVVAASETIADGAHFHFVLDPQVARDVYAPRTAARHALRLRAAR